MSNTTSALMAFGASAHDETSLDRAIADFIEYYAAQEILASLAAAYEKADTHSVARIISKAAHSAAELVE